MNFGLPYNSTREPVMGHNVVATSQPLAAQAGLTMLHAGGTAIDAAIATAAALTVVEPTANGLGSDAFAMWWDGETLHGLNASGRAPAGLDVERLHAAGGVPRLGWDAVTVPGAVSGWISMWSAGGTLPLPQLLAPAIAYARDGFALSPQTARGWARSVRRYANFDDWMATFAPNGRAPQPGEYFKSEAHACTLEAIADTNGEAFYQGDIAKRIAAAAEHSGAAMRIDDLQSHEPIRVEPLSVPLGDVELHELPPNGQGLAALVAAGVFERVGGASLDPDDPATMHIQIECMKLGFADASEHIGDPHLLQMDAAELIEPARLDTLAGMVDITHAKPLCSGVPQWSSTVYLATADARGRAVSFIQSNYEGFGSGIVIPDTGIAMQNRGAGFVLEDGHPNTLRPGARPYHTIIPGFTTCNGTAHMAFGVMGGPMQPQGHLQVLSRVTYGWNPQAALDAPRWRVEGAHCVAVEPQMPEQTIAALKSMGHDVQIATASDVSFGGGQVALRHGEGWIGASDCRRDGQAVAF